MRSRKGFALAAVFLAAVAAVGYYLREKPPTTGPTPLLAAPRKSLIPPASEQIPRQFRDWNDMVAEYQAAHPENAGLAHLRTALASLNTRAVGQHKDVIDKVLEAGWGAATPGLDAAVRSQVSALDAGFAAAASAPFPLPPAYDFSTQVPNFLSTQMLFKLMLLTARMAEPVNPDDAAMRSVATMRLAASFSDSHGFLVSYLIGQAGIRQSASTLGSILRNPRLSSQTSQQVADSLKELEGRLGSFADLVETEAQGTIRTVRRMKSGQVPMELDRETQNRIAAIQDSQRFEQEIDRVFVTIADNFRKPAHARAQLTVSQITSDPSVTGMAQANYAEAAVRADVALAYIRLCEALAILRTSNTESVSGLADVFAPKPVTVLADRVYSVGPDLTDQQGQSIYDPANGTTSSGDIVLRR
jgi:hypothetical protein